jgi:hypothetical protein
MAANRIRKFGSPTRGSAVKSAAAPTPQVPMPQVSIPHGFVLCPVQLTAANAWQQEIYRLAYQRAQAAVQIPRHYRLLFSCWN